MARENTVVEMIEVKTGDLVTGLEFKVGADRTRVMFSNLSPENTRTAMIYGVGVRVSRMAAIARDTKTGKSATPAEKFARVKACAEHLNSGATTWELARGTTGPRGPDGYTQLVVEAVAIIQGIELEVMTGRVKALCEKRQETMAAWAKRIAAASGENGDKIRDAILKLQQRAAPASDIDDDLDALLNGEDDDAMV
jgi:hypothetical protein